jgi:hypothetical protein
MTDETEPVALKSVFVQRKHHDQKEQKWQWSEESEQRHTAVAHQSKEQNLHCLLQQWWKHVNTEWEFYILPDLRNKSIHFLHNCCCCCCCCWMCYTRVSAKECQSKKISWEIVMKRLKKKTETTCWQAIRILSINLTWTTWKSHVNKQFIVQCSFTN